MVFEPILDILTKESSDLIVCGDVNIDLLKLKREKYSDYADLFFTNNFTVNITLPTRLAERSGTLIDHMFSRLTSNKKQHKSGIIVSRVSDHLPYFTCFNLKSKSYMRPKYIYINNNDEKSIQKFCNDINNIDFMSSLDKSIPTDPTENYNKIENTLTSKHREHMPAKRVKFNKYKHKINPWITDSHIIKIPR